MKELLDLCREAEVKDERKSVENGEKVCQLKFENLSMELELKEEAEVKEDLEEDMFADDLDLRDKIPDKGARVGEAVSVFRTPQLGTGGIFDPPSYPV